MTEAFTDDVEDDTEADSVMRVSRADGLPLVADALLHVTAIVPQDDGSEGSFRQRMRFGVSRLADDAPPGDAALSDFEILDSKREGVRALYAMWRLARAMTYEKGEEPEEARAEFSLVASMAGAALVARCGDAL